MDIVISLQHYLSNFHLGKASGWDILIIIAFIGAIFVYGLFLGRNRIIVLILSTYFSWIICNVLPWKKITAWKFLGMVEPSPSFKIFVFLGIILILWILIPHSVLSSPLRIRVKEGTWVQVFILSICQIGLLLYLLFSFLPKEVIAGFAPLIKKIFIGNDARLVWMCLPILALVLMKKKKKQE